MNDVLSMGAVERFRDFNRKPDRLVGRKPALFLQYLVEGLSPDTLHNKVERVCVRVLADVENCDDAGVRKPSRSFGLTAKPFSKFGSATLVGLSSEIVLIATVRLIFGSRARYTIPIEPLPSSSRISYLPKRRCRALSIPCRPVDGISKIVANSHGIHWALRCSPGVTAVTVNLLNVVRPTKSKGRPNWPPCWNCFLEPLRASWRCLRECCHPRPLR